MMMIFVLYIFVLKIKTRGEAKISGMAVPELLSCYAAMRTAALVTALSHPRPQSTLGSAIIRSSRLTGYRSSHSLGSVFTEIVEGGWTVE